MSVAIQTIDRRAGSRPAPAKGYLRSVGGRVQPLNARKPRGAQIKRNIKWNKHGTNTMRSYCMLSNPP